MNRDIFFRLAVRRASQWPAISLNVMSGVVETDILPTCPAVSKTCIAYDATRLSKKKNIFYEVNCPGRLDVQKRSTDSPYFSFTIFSN